MKTKAKRRAAERPIPAVQGAPGAGEDRRAQLAAQRLAEMIRAGREREAEYEATLDPRQRTAE